jgi:PhzF family phenazine biosynthesis protein
VIELEFRHLDVFSRRAFFGNGLVVVLDARELSPELMQAVTRQMRQFETVFLTDVDLDGRSAAVRIFTGGRGVGVRWPSGARRCGGASRTVIGGRR